MNADILGFDNNSKIWQQYQFFYDIETSYFRVALGLKTKIPVGKEEN